MKHLRTLAALFGAIIFAGMAAASPAFAYNIPLTMTSPTYDTSTQKYGTAALSGGYGLSPMSSNGITSYSSVTIEAWVKTSNATRVGVIAEVAATTYIAMNASGNAEFSSGGANATVSSKVITDGVWHHIALSCSATCLGFVDGVQVSSFAAGKWESNCRYQRRRLLTDTRNALHIL